MYHAVRSTTRQHGEVVSKLCRKVYVVTLQIDCSYVPNSNTNEKEEGDSLMASASVRISLGVKTRAGSPESIQSAKCLFMRSKFA